MVRKALLKISMNFLILKVKANILRNNKELKDL